MKLKVLSIVAIFVVGAALLSACENITPQQAKAIVATYEALPAPQRTAVAEKAMTYLKLPHGRAEGRNQSQDGSRAGAIFAGS